jgi:predicted dehydrogenase
MAPSEFGARPFNVGLIGVNPDAGWAVRAHLPALRAQPENFHIAGIANSNAASAHAAAAALGIDRAFDSVDALVTSPDVDIVVVTVKVPAHLDLVTRALEAGKHVYCEWPLGVNLAQAEAIARLAEARSVHTVIGTQARVAPAVRHVRDLVAKGFVGEVLSSTMIGNGVGWGAAVDRRSVYALDAANGATLLTIGVGHALVAVEQVLGEIETVSAELPTMRSHVRLNETGEMLPATGPDQVVIAATLANGAPLAIHYRGGMPKGPGFFWEINGTAGLIEVTGPIGQSQMLDLVVRGAEGNGDLVALPVPEDPLAIPGLTGLTRNVALVYRQLANDLRENSRTAPDFADAVKLHRLIDAIEVAAREGRRVTVSAA